MTWSPYISEIANLITYSTLKQNCFLEIVHDLNDLNYTKSIFHNHFYYVQWLKVLVYTVVPTQVVGNAA